MYKNNYCCCTGTVHCRYCKKRNILPHLTVDKDFNTVLISDKEQINELENIMNETTQKLDTQGLFISALKRAESYIVGSVSEAGYISFNTNPVLHSSPNSARTECKRLAGLSPGKLFVFVRLVGAEMVPTNTISI